MSYAIAAPKGTQQAARRKSAAKKPAPKRPSQAATIDRLLERVRTRGEALSADIKELLSRIG